MVRIELASEPSEELFEAVGRLLPQLKVSYPPFTHDHLAALLASDASLLFTARDQGGQIVGMLTLIVYPVPSGVRARIEDVVVDEAVRGRGIAVALVRQALEVARQRGADSVSLTSNPKREAANRLYQKIGFKRWETNVYVYRLDSA